MGTFLNNTHRSAMGSTSSTCGAENGEQHGSTWNKNGEQHTFPAPPSEVALDLLRKEYARHARGTSAGNKLLHITPVVSDDRSPVHAARCPQLCRGSAASLLPVHIAAIIAEQVPLHCALSLRCVSRTWLCAVDSVDDEHWLGHAALRVKTWAEDGALNVASGMEAMGATPTTRELVELYCGVHMTRYDTGRDGRSDATELVNALSFLDYTKGCLITPLSAYGEQVHAAGERCRNAWDEYRESATAKAWQNTPALTLAGLVESQVPLSVCYIAACQTQSERLSQQQVDVERGTISCLLIPLGKGHWIADSRFTARNVGSTTSKTVFLWYFQNGVSMDLAAGGFGDHEEGIKAVREKVLYAHGGHPASLYCKL